MQQKIWLSISKECKNIVQRQGESQNFSCKSGKNRIEFLCEPCNWITVYSKKILIQKLLTAQTRYEIYYFMYLLIFYYI